MAEHHYYASVHIDRVAHLRSDDHWMTRRLGASDTVLVPTWGTRNLVRSEVATRAVFIAAEALPEGLLELAVPVLLGLGSDDRAWVALAFERDAEIADAFVSIGAQFTDLRRVGAVLDRTDAGVLAFARAMANWHLTHRHCGACGAFTRVSDAGWLRTCSEPGCARQHFPRTDPAVIMRVTHGDRILLGRQPAWPASWYSVLAGFVEPGEGLEEAVRREVREEVGLSVRDIRYDSSQPWPFPQSLMLGFSAVADADALNLAGDELEDARWFRREEIRRLTGSGEIRLSPKVSISRHLIDVWLDAE